MSANCMCVIFMLLFSYGYCRMCDCEMLDNLTDIVQQEKKERENLVSRMDIMESTLNSVIGKSESSSEKSSDTSVLEKLSVLEELIGNFTNELKEAKLERQALAQQNSAITDGWKIHKEEFSIMRESIQSNIINNNITFEKLTKDVDERVEVIESKTELLINQTSTQAAEIMKEVENRLKYLDVNLSSVDEFENQLTEDFNIFKNSTDNSLSEIRSSLDTLRSFDMQRMNLTLYLLASLDNIRSTEIATVRSMLSYSRQIQWPHPEIVPALKSMTGNASYNVAFVAEQGEHPYTDGGNLVRFERVRLDLQHSYNAREGVFICPFGGLYHFAVRLAVFLYTSYYYYNEIDLTQAGAYITINGERKLKLLPDQDQGQDEARTLNAWRSFSVRPVSRTGSFLLDKGDKVYITTYFTGVLYKTDVHGYSSSFIGFLIRKT